MKSLFVTEEYNQLIERIGKLTPESKPLWGKMNVAQMLAHVNVGLNCSTGVEKPKRVFIGFLFGKLTKKSIFSEQPFKKSLPTSKNFIITDKKEFEREMDKLLMNLDRIFKAGPDVFTTHPHTFFGPLNKDEWNYLMYKHLDHHLQQFNA